MMSCDWSRWADGQRLLRCCKGVSVFVFVDVFVTTINLSEK